MESRFRKLFKIYERMMICNECGKELKPYCNTKIKDGKFYCVVCYWDLFGRAEMQQRFEKVK